MAATIVLVIFVVLVYAIMLRRGLDWITSLLGTALVFGIVVYALTELLSLFYLLTFGGVLLGWILLDVGAAATLIACAAAPASVPTPDLPQPVEPKPRLNLLAWVLLGVAAAIWLIVGMNGFCSATANWDSLTYHLSRVMHWMQNRSVAYYPTYCDPQLYEQPWAEYLILHFQILTSGDRLAFLPQWLGMGISMVGVWAIAARLGASPVGCATAALVVATTPLVVLHAPSTQHSLILSAWLCCMVYFLLLFQAAQSKGRLWPGLAFGAALALAIATHGSTYSLALPFVIWFAVVAIRGGLRWSLPVAAAAAAIVVLVNVQHAVRNYREFGGITAPPYYMKEFYLNAQMSPKLFASNIIRNTALQLQSPWPSMNDRIYNLVLRAHKAMGVDVDDPRTTGVPLPFAIPAETDNEDLTGNPVQVLLCLWAVGWAIIARRNPPLRHRVLGMLAVLACSFAVFCAMVKWQPWHTRLHLPLFVLASAPIGAALGEIRPQSILYGILVALIVSIWTALFHNVSHPLLGPYNIFATSREADYFRDRGIYPAYQKATDFLASRGDEHIFLFSAEDDYEYPLWMMLHSRLGHWPTILTGPLDADQPASGPSRNNIDAIVMLMSQPLFLKQVDATEPFKDWQMISFGSDVSVFVPGAKATTR
jgi:4-amino-4-deoxy-L-arabinose transferase-like glycosyltransferase